ncbi:MAG: alpha/beta fold hydrolase [Myxococcaceae bacterium]|nr:alpha/beta fold hydrolase [Myxococcaceae bacterium]MCA3012406.1 alpha/beta fold hydrolase [Myxococcaceae bacterium]
MRRLAVLLLFAAGCSRSGPRVETVPCVLPGVGREARCLTLERPEDPDVPAGRRVSVRVAVVPATGVRPLPDALFVFAGGPGQAAGDVAGAVMPLFAGLEARRDVVFVDQRGTGASSPLSCPDEALGKRPLPETVDEAAQAARLQACRRSLSDAGVDLAQYATWIAVRDVEAARQTLGYGAVNLWGASYGTRAALEYARQFPAAVRAVVLDGVAPASTPLPVALAFDTDEALRQLSARVDGGLDGALDALFAEDEKPARLVDPFYGDAHDVTLSRLQRLGLVRSPLYAPAFAAVLPLALARAARGDLQPLVGLGGGLGAGRLFTGMHFSVLCAEDVPRITDEHRRAVEATRAGEAFIDHYERACRDWPRRPVPAGFFAPPSFTAPTLLLSGGADPATPPRNASAAAAHLPNALHLVAPSLGHGVSAAGCASRLITRFFSTGTTAGLDGGCLEDLPPPALFEGPTP